MHLQLVVEDLEYACDELIRNSDNKDITVLTTGVAYESIRTRLALFSQLCRVWPEYIFTPAPNDPRMVGLICVKSKVIQFILLVDSPRAVIR